MSTLQVPIYNSITFGYSCLQNHSGSLIFKTKIYIFILYVCQYIFFMLYNVSHDHIVKQSDLCQSFSSFVLKRSTYGLQKRGFACLVLCASKALLK